MEKAKIKVLIVDDESLVRERIKNIFAGEEGIEVLAEAGDGQGAINIARNLQPDLILMDINMPGTNGIEATRIINREFPKMGVIAWAVQEDGKDVLELVRAGVSGYVVKDIAAAELVEAIKAVAAGYAVIDPRITRVLFEELKRLS